MSPVGLAWLGPTIRIESGDQSETIPILLNCKKKILAEIGSSMTVYIYINYNNSFISKIKHKTTHVYTKRSGYTSGYGQIAWGTIRPDTDK